MNNRRVDALLRQEMAEHKAVISSHHKEMQDLRDALKLAMDRFDSLYARSETDIKDMALMFNQQMISMKEKVATNEKLIADQKQTILSLYQQLHDFHLTYCNKTDVEKVKKDMDSVVKESTTTHISSFQNLQQEIKIIYASLREDLNKLKENTAQKFSDTHEYMATKLSASKLEKDGVLKEIRVYDKSQLIIEKKIENIYTLIERINKKGEACHKLES